MSNTAPNTGSRTWAIIGALGVGFIAVAVLVALYAIQIDRHDSKAEEAETHAQAVIYLQGAASEADAAGELVVAYVTEGDESLIPQIQEHSEAAIVGITNALSVSSSDEISAIARNGSSLADGAGQIIALMQTGNVEQAAATLEELRGSFAAFGTALEDATNSELDAAASLQTDADNADETASWLLIAALVFGVATGGGLLWGAARALRKHRIPETPTPA